MLLSMEGGILKISCCEETSAIRVQFTNELLCRSAWVLHTSTARKLTIGPEVMPRTLSNPRADIAVLDGHLNVEAVFIRGRRVP